MNASWSSENCQNPRHQMCRHCSVHFTMYCLVDEHHRPIYYRLDEHHCPTYCRVDEHRFPAYYRLDEIHCPTYCRVDQHHFPKNCRVGEHHFPAYYRSDKHHFPSYCRVGEHHFRRGPDLLTARPHTEKRSSWTNTLQTHSYRSSSSAQFLLPLKLPHRRL